jgi:nucleoside-diphosphate-sugar epimerase
MNILVLGANGYSGAYLVKALLERGHSVRGLVRTVERGIPLEKMGMDLRVGDILDDGTLQNVADDCEIIFNLVANCRIEPSEAREILTNGAQNVFRHVDRSALKKYIWVSNVSVYGFPKKTDRLTQTSPMKPTYGLGKITVEAEKLARDSVPAIAIRVASIYGKGRDFISALKENRLRLLNGGENYSSRIHVEDLVATLLAAMKLANPGDTYLAADDLPFVQRDFFKEICAASGAPMPANLEVNAARAFGVFGRAMNSLAGERQYQLSENVIGLLTGNYFCVNDSIKNNLGVTLKYPTFREGYREILRDG